VTSGRSSVLGPWAGAVARPPSDVLDVARREGGLTRGDHPVEYDPDREDDGS
jgi:hypothetical protein